MGMSEWDNGLKSDIFFVQAWYQMFGGHGGLLKEFVYVGIGLLDYKEDRILAKTIWYKIQFGLFRSYCKIKLALGSSSILRVMKRRVGVFILLEESFKIMIWSWYLSGPNIEYCLEGCDQNFSCIGFITIYVGMMGYFDFWGWYDDVFLSCKV